MWGVGMFFVLFHVCRVKTMRFESAGGRREPRAGKTYLPIKLLTSLDNGSTIILAINMATIIKSININEQTMYDGSTMILVVDVATN